SPPNSLRSHTPSTPKRQPHRSGEGSSPPDTASNKPCPTAPKPSSPQTGYHPPAHKADAARTQRISPGKATDASPSSAPPRSTARADPTPISAPTSEAQDTSVNP